MKIDKIKELLSIFSKAVRIPASLQTQGQKIVSTLNAVCADGFLELYSTESGEKIFRFIIRDNMIIQLGPIYLIPDKKAISISLYGHISKSSFCILDMKELEDILILLSTLLNDLLPFTVEQNKLHESLKDCLSLEKQLMTDKQNTVESYNSGTLHIDRKKEKQFYENIQRGDIQNIMSAFKEFIDSGRSGVLSEYDALRNAKNLAIATITLATRASMEGGLDEESVFALSDETIRTIEKTTTVAGVNQLVLLLIENLTRKVHASKFRQLSFPIHQSVSFMKRNIYNKWNLADLSSYVNKTPAYLSHQFKKETGTRIMEYNNELRIEEAKNLLKYTNMNILDISTSLHYTTQSYFAKIFKEIEGITPSEYQTKNNCQKI